MENIILKGMLDDFVSRFELSSESIGTQFEKFLNYCLLNEDYYDSFDFEKVGTGKCLGIDGLAIALGGVIVDDLETASAFTKGQFDVEFRENRGQTTVFLFPVRLAT